MAFIASECKTLKTNTNERKEQRSLALTYTFSFPMLTTPFDAKLGLYLALNFMISQCCSSTTFGIK